MKLKTYLIVTGFFLCSFAHVALAQQVGDFRSVASGNWTSVGVWQMYDGTSWTAATSYPGQNSGTNDVFIEGGYSIYISTSIPNTVNSLNVGDGTGALDNFFVSNTASLPTQLVTITDGGYAEWTANKSFYLPSGAAFVIESGGELSTDSPCSAGKRLVIGSVIYSTCNGGARADYSFQELNDNGGSLAVSPSSNSPICEGEALTLFANPSGTGSSGATYSWSGPSGYSSTSINPIVSGLTAGTYTYTVTITDSNGNTNTNSTTATVSASPNITSTIPGSRIGPGTVTLGATASSGTLSWYSAPSGGSAIGSGTSFVTPSISTTTTFYVEATDNGCASASRSAVTATIIGDNDSDGVDDITDLDDDNDGILDTVENECVTNTEVNNFGYSTSTDLSTGTSGTLSNLAANGSNYIDFDYTLNGTATWNNGVQIRDDAGAVGSNTLYLQPSNVADGNGSATYEFIFSEVSLIDNITFGGIEYDDRLVFEAFDDAGNAIPLTSSNFAATGSVSAVGNDYTYIGTLQSFSPANYVNETVSFNIQQEVKRLVITSGKADGANGNNTVEVYNFSYCNVTDSDEDGIGDYLEADSDSDGCNDAIEAGFSDPDNDGILGTSPVTVDSNGQVTGQGGYTTPADADGNSIYDFQESGTAASITILPTDVTAYAGSGASFSVSVNNTDTYQWQLSINGGSSFSDVSEGGIYSGTDSDTLSLSAIDLSMQNYRYRVVVSNSAYSCASPVTSNVATLMIRVRTVITNKKITYRVKKN